MYISKN